ncbi:hypothetical protein FACS1894139_01980 [Planctomycetales bacterium]|nr:hypothetical protein FACS1894108_02100 [Planctomycetales bacterium]GHT02894.1 hypothetical protein FACS1894139_01980 [Planctomycetales bacterium]
MSHDHDHHEGCACEKSIDAAPLTAAEQAAIAGDPATGSLAKALKGGFAFLKIVMLVLLLFFILDRFRSVSEGEIMVIERFGAFLTDDRGQIKVFAPGKMYFLFPAPIDRPVVLRASEVKELDLATAFYPRVGAEQSIGEALPNTDELDPLLDGYNLTGDLNLLHTRWKVKYRISDYRDYLLATQNGDPTALLAAAVENAILRNVAATTVDDAYYNDHRGLFERIDDETRAQLAEMKLGIDLDGSIANQSLRPPGPANAAFNQVTSSLSERKKLVDEARKNAATILQEAATEALQINHDALEYKTAVVADAKANAARIRDLQAKFPGDAAGLNLYLSQYRYDRLVDILAPARVYLLRKGQNVFWTAPTPEYLDEP